MDPTVPPVLSLPGAVHPWIDGVDGVIFNPGAAWLTLLGFHFAGSGVTATLMARSTQSSDWGRSGLRPPLPASDYLLPGGLFVKPDRTSRSNVPWNGSVTTLWRPLPLRQISGSSAAGIHLNLLRGPFSSQFLLGHDIQPCGSMPGFPPEGELLTGPSRFCSVETLWYAPGLHTTPVCASWTSSQISRPA
jgi:hypothetical protein